MNAEVIPFPAGVPVADRVGDLDDFVRELVARGFDIGAPTTESASTPAGDDTSRGAS